MLTILVHLQYISGSVHTSKSTEISPQFRVGSVDSCQTGSEIAQHGSLQSQGTEIVMRNVLTSPASSTHAHTRLTSALPASEARTCEDSIASSKLSFLLEALASVSWSRVNNSTSDFESDNTCSLEAMLAHVQ